MVETKYPRTVQMIERTMKVLQREMDDNKDKVKILGGLLEFREMLLNGKQANSN